VLDQLYPLQEDENAETEALLTGGLVILEIDIVEEEFHAVCIIRSKAKSEISYAHCDFEKVIAIFHR